jgi:glycosyltransferase involved in cell wall biosynthesis
MRLVIEGWRDFPHSFTIVNCFQILELLKRPPIELFHVDQPFTFNPAYPEKRAPRLFNAEQSALIRGVPAPQAGMAAHATYRIVTRFDFSRAASRRTAVFVNAEWGRLKFRHLREAGIDPEHVAARVDPDVVLVTPSRWSKWGLERAGLRPESIAVVPHGVDPDLFKPAAPARREELRRRRGWQDAFVFVNNSLMGEAKGLDLLLKAFAIVAARHPHAKLLLKGRDDIVSTQKLVDGTIRRSLAPAAGRALSKKILYSGKTSSFETLAGLYQAADAYAAPYRAEAFSLPVLEAAACGLPVICTRGGPTDDFTTGDFALRIESRFATVRTRYGEEVTYLEPDFEHLVAAMHEVIESPGLGARARDKGPEFVRANFTWARAVDRLLEVLA